MRASNLSATGLLLLSWTLSASADAPTPVSHVSFADGDALKAATAGTVALPDPILVAVGGDTIGSATVIPALPFSDAGNTCSYASDYESCVGCFSCPFNHPGARDVVYRFTPVADVCVTVDLCSSAYDTKVYIGDGGAAPVVACDDDGCYSSLYRSIIRNAPLEAGRTYYIFVDGYSSADCGDYVMSVAECETCTVVCPPESIAEGEPTCYDNYNDAYNSGCQGNPPVFTYLECGYTPSVVVCGTYGGYTYNGLSYRDTDWYQIELTHPATVTLCVEGEYETLCGIIDGRPGCLVTGFYDYNFGGACTPLCVTDDLAVGTWWVWVGTLGFGADAGECGGAYVATLAGLCDPPIAVDASTWGRIKGIYR